MRRAILLWLIGLVALLLALLTFAYSFKGHIYNSVNWKYWLVILAGNWSPDSRPADIGKFLFAISAVLAITLNVGNMIALGIYAFNTLKLLHRFGNLETHVREQSMFLKNIYAVRDLSIKNSILTRVSPEMRDEITGLLEQGFTAGDKVWYDEHLNILLGDEGAARLRQAIEKTDVEAMAPGPS